MGHQSPIFAYATGSFTVCANSTICPFAPEGRCRGGAASTRGGGLSTKKRRKTELHKPVNQSGDGDGHGGGGFHPQVGVPPTSFDVCYGSNPALLWDPDQIECNASIGPMPLSCVTSMEQLGTRTPQPKLPSHGNGLQNRNEVEVGRWKRSSLAKLLRTQ